MIMGIGFCQIRSGRLGLCIFCFAAREVVEVCDWNYLEFFSAAIRRRESRL